MAEHIENECYNYCFKYWTAVVARNFSDNIEK